MEIESHRLLLREWKEEDAPDLYELAKDPEVGPAGGWPAHRSVSESRRIIAKVLRDNENYAIVLKESERVIGCVGLLIAGKSHLDIHADEAELGYWLGRRYWRQHYMTEACEVLLTHAFGELGLSAVWAEHYEENERSRGLQEKLGMRYRYTQFVPAPLLHDAFTADVRCITKEEFLRRQKKE